MKVRSKFIIGIILFSSLSACQQQVEKREAIATAYDYTLYMDELVEMMPDDIHAQDSVLFVQTYINQWFYKKVELHYAEMNLEQVNLDFSRQIEDYRNSLLIYEYQKRLVEQRLDTVVSDEEVQIYYDEHKDDFTLKRNIVQVAFLKIPREDERNIKQVKKLLREYRKEDMAKLRDIADHSAANYLLDEDVWLFFDDLTKEIPIKTYNQVSFLRNNRVLVEQDSLFTFLVRINDFKVADSESPIEFEYDRIISIIINIRKLDLIQRMEEEIFTRAQVEGKIKVIN